MIYPRRPYINLSKYGLSEYCLAIGKWGYASEKCQTRTKAWQAFFLKEE